MVAQMTRCLICAYPRRGSYVIEIEVPCIGGLKWMRTHSKPFVMPLAVEREYDYAKQKYAGLSIRVLNHGVVLPHYYDAKHDFDIWGDAERTVKLQKRP
jgi:hypothetical protein